MLLQNFGGKNKPEKSAPYPSGVNDKVVCIHIPVAFLFNYFSYHNGILSAALLNSLIISHRKPRQDPDFKPKRKRSMSFSLPGEHRFGNRWWHKRTRVLPTKFLLGGSITDPLNLGSLDKEEVVQ